MVRATGCAQLLCSLPLGIEHPQPYHDGCQHCPDHIESKLHLPHSFGKPSLGSSAATSAEKPVLLNFNSSIHFLKESIR
jgi:hypothetical protein